MEQPGTSQSLEPGRLRKSSVGHLDRMALVGGMLAPEELSFRRSEQRHDLGLFARPKRTGRDETEEPSECRWVSWVTPLSRQAVFSALQSTQ